MRAQTRKKLEAGQQVRIGIMGGTFDPIHYGHLAAAHAALEQLDLAEVAFLPTGQPAFKLERDITPGDVRFSMCLAAIEGVDEFSVNAMEIMREGVTYSAETLKQLSRGKHPCMHFVFILGADSAATLLRWRDQETLRSLASYAVVTRAGQEVPQSTLQALREAGFSLELVEAQTPLVSSTDIRQRVLEGKDISRLVPAGVERIIREKGLYLPKPLGIDDPLSDEFFEARKQELETRVTAHRFRHSLGVAQMSAHLASVYEVDPRKARLAGILHDWDKNYDDQGIRARVDELGMSVDPFVYAMLPRVLHAHTAPVALARQFPALPEDVLRAMDRHTIAACDMGKLDMVLYIADALEPNRDYPGVEELREKIGVISLEELFFNIYEYWIIRMMERKMQLHPNTVDVWNHYAGRQSLRAKEKK